MSWHHIPKDDAWKQAHLAMLVKLGKRAWLHCDDCRHSVMIEPHELARQYQLDLLTPLLTISRAMRSTRCGAWNGCYWPEPHNTRANGLDELQPSSLTTQRLNAGTPQHRRPS